MAWIIGSPFFVNYIFQKEASFDIATARYSAGDLLMYISGVMTLIGTVSLGCVSYYQTRHSNKIAEDSARLAQEANEISLVIQIIEQEVHTYNELQERLDDYSRLCLPQNILFLRCKLTDNCDNVTIDGTELLVEKRNELLKAFTLVSRSLRQDNSLKQSDSDPFKKACVAVFRWPIDYIDYYTKEFPTTRKEYSESDITAYQEYYEKVFMMEREKYLEKYERRISHLLYEKHTLDEVRAICNMN